MRRIEIIESEINQIIRTYRLLKSEQGGRLTADQIDMKDDLLSDKLSERDRISAEIVGRGKFDPDQDGKQKTE